MNKFIFLMIFTGALLESALAGPLTPSISDHPTELIPNTNIIYPLQIQSTIEPDFNQWTQEPLVVDELKRLQSNAAKIWLNQGLERSELFRGFIVSFLEVKKLPRDLLWLVMIESVFNDNAVSKSGAAGLWQFMRNSMGTELVANEWLDERYDFWKATSAALNKLSYNFTETNDWLMAIAAYNAGLGRIKRLMKEYPGLNFWELADKGLLPTETVRYVPRFIAVSILCNRPVRNGLSYSWNTPIEWVRVPLSRPISLEILEKKTGIPIDLLQRGNSELHHGITPPGKMLYSLKIPVSYVGAIESALLDDTLLIEYAVHHVKSGDTLFALALKHKTSVEMILSCNPQINAKALQLNATLIIPLSPHLQKES